MMYPIWAISESMSTRIKERDTVRKIFRTSVVIASAFVAFSCPDFGKFLSLVGSSLCTILGFILPCYFHLTVLREESPFWQVCLNYFLLNGGALFGILGTFSSVKAMLNGDLVGHS